MKIKAVDHIAINTRNFEESVKFYRDVLGMKQLEAVKMDDCTIAYFGIPGGGRMELFDYYGQNKAVEKTDSDAGLRHIAFTVDGVKEHEEKLRKLGVTITLPATELPSLGARVLLFLDPNGITLEFCEAL